MKKNILAESATCVVVGLAFAWIGGLVLLKGAAPRAYDWLRMQSWEQTEAVLLEVRDARSTQPDGQPSDLPKTQVLYRYDFNGQTYEAARLSISRSVDSIGNFHSALRRRVIVAHQNQQPVQVWVNPHNPSEAVIDASLRPDFWAIQVGIVAVFGGIGVLLLWCGLWFWPRRARAFASDKPWLAKRCWANNHIPSDGKSLLWMCFALALGFSVLLPIPLKIIPMELERDNWFVLILLVFPIISVALWVLFFRILAQLGRRGKVYLSMSPLPGRIGGDLRGYVDFKRAYSAGQSVSVRVYCERVEKSGGSTTRTREYGVWQSRCKATTSPGPLGTRVEFHCSVPAGLPSSEISSRRFHRWKVKIKDSEQNIFVFEIPVFAY